MMNCDSTKAMNATPRTNVNGMNGGASSLFVRSMPIRMPLGEHERQRRIDGDKRTMVASAPVVRCGRPPQSGISGNTNFMMQARGPRPRLLGRCSENKNGGSSGPTTCGSGSGAEDEGGSSVMSSLTPTLSYAESAQFSLELRDATPFSEPSVDGSSANPSRDSDCSSLTYSSSPSSTNDNSYQQDYASRSHQPEITRPSNPPPPSKSSSPTSSSSSPSTVAKAKAAGALSTVSSPSLIQQLLKRSRRHRHKINQPPSKIYLPAIRKNQHASREGEEIKYHHQDKTDEQDTISPLMLPVSREQARRNQVQYEKVPAACSLSKNDDDCCPPEYIVVQDNKQRQRMKKRESRDLSAASSSSGSNSNTPISTDEYELQCSRLQEESASLHTQQQELQDELTKLENEKSKGESTRFEVLRTLASCEGDAKDPTFVSFVEDLEKSRNGHRELLEKLEEVTRELTTAEDKLEELCVSGTVPPSPSSSVVGSMIRKMSPSPMSDPAMVPSTSLEGQWFTLTKPTYPDCLGFNDDGNPMYTLGRMSFEMFRPGDLVLSIEAVFNPIMDVVDDDKGGCGFSVPKTLQEEVKGILDGEEGRQSGLKTYHIVTAFQIEPYCPSFGPSSPNLIVQQPIRGIMTTYGYALPDPEDPERLSVWFSGGKMECGEARNSRGFKVWKQIFGNDEVVTGECSTQHDSKQKSKKKRSKKKKKRRTFREGVMVAAAHLLMGAEGYNDDMDEETGTMAYTFSRPVGGHGKGYVDILHLDDTTRVMRGHAGTLYVFTRLGGKKA